MSRTRDVRNDLAVRIQRLEDSKAISTFLQDSGSFIRWTLHYMVSLAIRVPNLLKRLENGHCPHIKAKIEEQSTGRSKL